MASKVKALQQWCKIQCDGYRDVSVTNMTSSWKSGLAFCAIIHRYCPDLIDFDSLSKENVYENNKLAFDTADEKLNIPALLDAEDMVTMTVPDKLCIVTYVSQYYNYFCNKEKVGGPGVQRAAVKRPLPASLDQDKQQQIKRTTPNHKSEKENENPTPRSSFDDTCSMCKSKVFLMERHYDGKKLYHRHCFREVQRSDSRKALEKTKATLEPKFKTTPHLVKNPSESNSLNNNSIDISPSVALHNNFIPTTCSPSNTSTNQFSQSHLQSGEKAQSSFSPSHSTNNSCSNSQISKNHLFKTSNIHTNNLLNQHQLSPSPNTVSASVSVNNSNISSSQKTNNFTQSDLQNSHTTGANLHSKTPYEKTSPLKSEVVLPRKPRIVVNLKSSSGPVKQSNNQSNVSMAPSPIKSPVQSWNWGEKMPLNTPTHLSPTQPLVTKSKMLESNTVSSPTVTTTSSPSLNNNESEIFSGLLGSLANVRKNHTPTENCKKFSSDLSSADYIHKYSKHSNTISTDTKASDSTNFSTKSSTVFTTVGAKNPITTSTLMKSSLEDHGKNILNKDNYVKNSLNPIVITTTDVNKKTPKSILKPSKYVEHQNSSSNLHTNHTSTQSILTDTIKTVNSGAKTIVNNHNPNKPNNPELNVKLTSNFNKPTPVHNKPPIISDTNSKPEWMVEAEKRRKMRGGKYVDPEKAKVNLLMDSVSKNVGNDIKKPQTKLSETPEINNNIQNKLVTDKKNKTFMNTETNMPGWQIKVQQKEKDKSSWKTTPEPSKTTNLPFQTKPGLQDLQLKKFQTNVFPNQPQISQTNHSLSQITFPITSSQTSDNESNTNRSHNGRPPSVKRSPPLPKFGSGRKHKNPFDQNHELIQQSDMGDNVNPGVTKLQNKIEPDSRFSFSSDSWEHNNPINSGLQHLPERFHNGELARRPLPERPSNNLPAKRQINAEKRVPAYKLLQDLEDLDIQLRELERQGRHLELKIRTETDEAMDDIDLMVQWFDLINKKNELVRKESDLMYKSKQQELEDRHMELEYEFRCLMQLPDSSKTSSDKIREEAILKELVDTVLMRSYIVDSIEEDRIRYIEEDKEIAQMMARKNLLPVTKNNEDKVKSSKTELTKLEKLQKKIKKKK